ALYMRIRLLFTLYSLFSFDDTAPTEIYALSLHDALPISRTCCSTGKWCNRCRMVVSFHLHQDMRGLTLIFINLLAIVFFGWIKTLGIRTDNHRSIVFISRQYICR